MDDDDDDHCMYRKKPQSNVIATPGSSRQTGTIITTPIPIVSSLNTRNVLEIGWRIVVKQLRCYARMLRAYWSFTPGFGWGKCLR
jgi:hypothetical protein